MSNTNLDCHNADRLDHFLGTVMGFTRLRGSPTEEMVYQRSIPKSLFAIQINSGLTTTSKSTPPPALGIRIYLMDLANGEPITNALRVRRTSNCLPNIRAHVGDLWKWVLDHMCGCGEGILIEAHTASSGKVCSNTRCKRSN